MTISGIGDRDLIVSGSYDDTVRLWTSRREAAAPRWPLSPVRAVTLADHLLVVATVL
jgi:hypothetical protein